jgi:hypothetical protein
MKTGGENQWRKRKQHQHGALLALSGAGKMAAAGKWHEEKKKRNETIVEEEKKIEISMKKTSKTINEEK